MAARRAHRGRRPHRPHPDPGQGLHLQARRAHRADLALLRLLPCAHRLDPHPHRRVRALHRDREVSASPPGSCERTPSGTPGPDRNLALELVRVTEAAALAAARLIGMGDKEAADQAAVDAMRLMLDSVRMDGVVVIGEGEKDEAPMLYNGEHIGDGSPPEVDIAVDPLEGTRLCALGMPSALAVISLAERGTMFDPGPVVYMEKLAGGPRSPTCSTSTGPSARRSSWWPSARASTFATSWSSCSTARATRRASRRSASAGARVRLIPDGDVSAALLAVDRRHRRSTCCGASAARPRASSRRRRSSASAASCVGRLWPRDDDERQAALDAGYDLEQILTVDDLVRRRRLLLLGHRRDRRRRPRRASATRAAPARHDRVARHALALGHGAANLRPPRPRQAAASSAGGQQYGQRPTPGEAARRATRRRSRRASERRNAVRDEHVDARLGDACRPGARAREAIIG